MLIKSQPGQVLGTFFKFRPSHYNKFSQFIPCVRESLYFCNIQSDWGRDWGFNGGTKLSWIAMIQEIKMTKFCFCIIFFLVCIQNIANCALCLDHTTCQRCQKSFILLESYWGSLCVASCPKDFTEIKTSSNGLVCKSSKGMDFSTYGYTIRLITR